jgi:hypothetical protein
VMTHLIFYSYFDSLHRVDVLMCLVNVPISSLTLNFLLFVNYRPGTGFIVS